MLIDSNRVVLLETGLTSPTSGGCIERRDVTADILERIGIHLLNKRRRRREPEIDFTRGAVAALPRGRMTWRIDGTPHDPTDGRRGAPMLGVHLARQVQTDESHTRLEQRTSSR